MSEELGFHGNELVHFQTMYMVGTILGQLPFAVLFPKVRMNWLIPSLDICWGIFTLLQYRANSYSEIMAYRFMVGLFEPAYFPGVQYVLGAWYRADEIGRRGGVFYVGLTLGTLTAGLLQGAAVANLDGANGLSGWRWAFIINTIITLPLGFVGFFLWPGTPDKVKSVFLSAEEVALAKKRLERAGHRQPDPLTWAGVKRVFTSWRLYVLIMWDTFFCCSATNTTAAGYLLWLKSLNRYSVERVNQLSVTSPAVGIFYVLFIALGADFFLGRALAITLASTWNLIGLVILIIWNVPEYAKWFAFNTTYSSVAVSSVLYGWANDILKQRAQERSFALVAMTAIGQATAAWTPLLVNKTVEAPRFPKGYAFTAASAVLLIAMTWIVKWMHDKQE